ncbi:MAG: Hsp70 family protein [Alphaproteobacteria bacterium]|nr:Hsp70 family protein [Alphaproteobacteria bacterium]
MYIGIDLGTTNSVIAGLIDSEARTFRPADGGEVLPSVIYVDKRGRRLYGRRAYDQFLIAPENVAAGFKRLMGTSTPIEITGADLTLTPEECSAEIIRQLLGQAATETGAEDFTGAIIAIPASFNQMQSEATLRAAKMAGLEHVDLLQEPVAAALAAMASAKRSGQFLIYDLGGGTFDVALAKATDGEVSIIAQQGINMLGGRDFDRMIVSEIVRPWLIANFDLPDNFFRDPQYNRLIRVALLAAEKAKIDLSSLEEASIFASDDEVRLMDQSEAEIFLDAPITRSQFEELIRKPVGQTIEMIRHLLEENEVSSDAIDRIVFIGGPSRIPLVRQMVSDELGIPADLKTDPMTAVAVGAAYYCESRQWEKTNLTSTPKPLEVSDSVPEEPGLTFDYSQRTADDKTVVTAHLSSPLAKPRQLQLTTEGWDSGLLPLVDGLTIMLPLSKPGDHIFNVLVLDENGQPLPNQNKTIIVTRVQASAHGITATHTIAVKALEREGAQENILLPLVAKSAPLPSSGQVTFRSGHTLASGHPGSVSFELFQVEYPERVELNLCVGLFRIDSSDLPEGQTIRAGDMIVFDWNMSESGILRATVRLPANKLELRVPHFYAPQAGEISFNGENGVPFAQAVLQRGREEWGDLAAALGPEGGPEMGLLKTRLDEQFEILEESVNDPETIRRIAEEARFIRQDIARLGKKHGGAMLQRQLGKMTAVFNRVVRNKATEAENGQFDERAHRVQAIIEGNDPQAYDEALLRLSEMRSLFFNIAWRDSNYIQAWYQRLIKEPYLFPEQAAFRVMVAEGEKLIAQNDPEGLRDLVLRMLESRVALGTSDIASELATIVKG